MGVGMNAHRIRTKEPVCVHFKAYIRSMRFQYPSPPNGGCTFRVLIGDPTERMGRLKPGTEDAGLYMCLFSITAAPC